MRLLTALSIVLTFASCATPSNLTPEQQADRQARWSHVATSAAQTALRIADGYVK